jgi:hypothetical protein
MKDGIRMDVREIGWGSAEWIQFAGSCEYGDETSGSGSTNLIRINRYLLLKQV